MKSKNGGTEKSNSGDCVILLNGSRNRGGGGRGSGSTLSNQKEHRTPMRRPKTVLPTSTEVTNNNNNPSTDNENNNLKRIDDNAAVVVLSNKINNNDSNNNPPPSSASIDDDELKSTASTDENDNPIDNSILSSDDVSSVAVSREDSPIIEGATAAAPGSEEEEELSRLRCASVRTEETQEKQKEQERRRKNRCADYPGLAFGSAMFGSDTMMKFNIIKNELHNIMRSQLKRVDGEVIALTERIKNLDKDLEKSEHYIKTATVALAEAVEMEIEYEKKEGGNDIHDNGALSQFDAQMALLEGQLIQAKVLAEEAEKSSMKEQLDSSSTNISDPSVENPSTNTP